MEAKSKSARVVPASSSASNILASGSSGRGGRRKCDAWSENEHTSGGKESDPSEPFIGKESSESETTSVEESERLFKKPKGRIYSIDLESVSDPHRKKPRSSVLSETSTESNSSTNSSSSENSKQNSHFDAKLVDKFVKTNRKRRKRKDAKNAFIKLCQCCPWTVPWSLLVVSAIQICTYIFNSDNFYQLLIFSPVRQFEVWRFVTYTFLHAGAVHLMLNVIIQIIVAFPLETEQGHGNVLLVYFAGVLAGGMGASMFEPTLMVGASAGVYCLLMSHIPHIVMNFKSLSHRYFRILAVLVLCISDVIYSIRHFMTKGNLQPRIGVPAHVSGALCGLLIGFVAYRGEKLAVFRAARYIAAILYVGWIFATVVYNLQVKS